jgi:hypothetical protein
LTQRFSREHRVVLEKEVVIAGDKDLVRERLRVEPSQELFDLARLPAAGRVAAVHKDVALGEPDIVVPVVCVADDYDPGTHSPFLSYLLHQTQVLP